MVMPTLQKIRKTFEGFAEELCLIFYKVKPLVAIECKFLIAGKKCQPLGDGTRVEQQAHSCQSKLTSCAFSSGSVTTKAPL